MKSCNRNMLRMISIMGLIILVIILSGSVSAATWVVGEVYNALDGEGADDHVVVLWRPDVGIQDNVTDIIGPNGRSNKNNTYMINCDALSAGCNFGDEVRVRVLEDLNGYVTDYVNMSIGSGVNRMGGVTLNSPPFFLNISVDDDFSNPIGEIDLSVGSTKEVLCQGVIIDYDGDHEISNVSSEFFDNVVSGIGLNDDNNEHYTNGSCFLNKSYGFSNESYFECGYDVWYYSNPGEWNCSLQIYSNFSNFTIGVEDSNVSNINLMLALGVDSLLDFGLVNLLDVSDELEANVTNYGNGMMNLSLEGYARTRGDNYSMNCTLGGNISIEYQKYNLTDSNTSNLGLSQFESIYKNLSSASVVNRLGLNYRQNDTDNEAVNSTYWRIYVPVETAGSCVGNIIFGASQESGS